MADKEMCNCMVCERIARIKQGKNPYFVRELETGYVVLGDYQRFKGYTLFLCKEHATELHFLENGFTCTGTFFRGETAIRPCPAPSGDWMGQR